MAKFKPGDIIVSRANQAFRMVKEVKTQLYICSWASDNVSFATANAGKTPIPMAYLETDYVLYRDPIDTLIDTVTDDP